MNRVQQMASVTELQKETVKVFGKLDGGPVVLASHSKPAAVLVSVQEWDSIADKLAERRFTQKQVEAIIAAYRQRDNNEPTLSSEELAAKIAKRHGHVESQV